MPSQPYFQHALLPCWQQHQAVCSPCPLDRSLVKFWYGRWPALHTPATIAILRALAKHTWASILGHSFRYESCAPCRPLLAEGTTRLVYYKAEREVWHASHTNTDTDTNGGQTQAQTDTVPTHPHSTQQSTRTRRERRILMTCIGRGATPAAATNTVVPVPRTCCRQRGDQRISNDAM